MFVCDPCIKEHLLESNNPPNCYMYAPCEICGELRNKWRKTDTVWCHRPESMVQTGLTDEERVLVVNHRLKAAARKEGS